MSQRPQGCRKHRPKPSLLPPQWTGAATLELVWELNERALDVLADMAQMTSTSRSLDLVCLYQDLWADLDTPARKRAARCPFLLVDVHFQSDAWWNWATAPRSHIGKDTVSLSPLPANLAKELMYETLVLAWHTARSDSCAANALLAMSPKVAATLARLGLRDIHHIATHHSHYLRPQWENLPLFWRHLLIAAHSDDNAALHEVHLHGLQLLGTNLS